jgi:hypothetical protein
MIRNMIRRTPPSLSRIAFTALASLAALALSACASTSGAAAQGNSSSPVQDSGFSAQSPGAYLTGAEAALFAKQIERDLASKGARVGIVFRTGRARKDLPEGIAYTHGAFWVYTPITLDDGRTVNGYAVYNLYHGDGSSLPKDQSYLHQDWPVDFVAGTAVDDVAVIVPTPEMQRRILGVMDSSAYRALHRPAYSLVSNPLDIRYQNCNEFMLDVIAAAAWETTDIPQIKANLKAHYTPTRVRTGLVERLLGPMADNRLKTDDQSGRIVTATYESMAAFMKDKALLKETYTLVRAK